MIATGGVRGSSALFVASNGASEARYPSQLHRIESKRTQLDCVELLTWKRIKSEEG